MELATEAQEDQNFLNVNVEEIHPPPSSSALTFAASHKSSKKSRTSFDSKIDHAVDAIVDYVKDGTDETRYTAFGKTVAMQLSELTPIEATEMMDEIHQLLSKNIIKSMLARNKGITSRNSRKMSHSTSVESSGSDRLQAAMYGADILFDEEDTY